MTWPAPTMPPPNRSPPMPWPATQLRTIPTTVITTTYADSTSCDAGHRRDAMKGTALVAMQGTGVMRVATYNIGAKTNDMFTGRNRREFQAKLKKNILQLQAVVT
eukprot:11480332-Heterocapsa_arctica.AAC.1